MFWDSGSVFQLLEYFWNFVGNYPCWHACTGSRKISIPTWGYNKMDRDKGVMLHLFSLFIFTTSIFFVNKFLFLFRLHDRRFETSKSNVNCIEEDSEVWLQSAIFEKLELVPFWYWSEQTMDMMFCGGTCLYKCVPSRANTWAATCKGCICAE